MIRLLVLSLATILPVGIFSLAVFSLLPESTVRGTAPFVSPEDQAPNPWGSFLVEMVTTDETGTESTFAIAFEGQRQWHLELMAVQRGDADARPTPRGGGVGQRRSQNGDAFRVCPGPIGMCTETLVVPAGRVVPPVAALDANLHAAAMEGRDGWQQAEANEGVTTFTRVVQVGPDQESRETVTYDRASSHPLFHRVDRPDGTFLESRFVHYRDVSEPTGGR